jgi:uncharacterized protein involved in exopolysaccharide biosynthesis
MNNTVNSKIANNQQSEDDPSSGGTGEISLSDAVDFVKKSWKVMMLCSILGIISAAVFVATSTPMYEAVAQIRMAQISQINPANPFGTPIEDPSSLIARMQFPTNYSADIVSECGYQDKPQPALALSKAVKFSIPKGLTNAVEVRISAHTPNIAEKCVNALFLQIIEMQERLSRAFVDEAKLKLAVDNERIEAARKLIAKADQSGAAMSAAYLSARDELTYFLTDREKMSDLINSVKSRGTRLDSPIYSSDRPISPKTAVSLLAGLGMGFFLGILLSLGRRLIR